MSNQERCSNKAWGFLAANVPDPPSCVAECRMRFLAGLTSLPGHETLDVVCELLSDTRSDTSPLWDLYCCDSQLCGVNNLESHGEDPNVNWVINTCQKYENLALCHAITYILRRARTLTQRGSNGYHTIADPGPPSKAFSCRRKTILGDDPGCGTHSSAATTDTTTDTTNSHTSMATSTYSSIHDPSLGAEIDNPGRDNGTGGSGGISTGIKVAIAICVFAAVVLLVIALAIFLRRRRRASAVHSDLRDCIRHPTLSPPPTESPTPLISPAATFGGPPLSPPLPLKERRLHPVGSRPSSSSTIGGKPPLEDTTGFPASPVYSPTRGTLVPRPEQSVRFAGSPPLSPLKWFSYGDGRGGEAGSLRSLSSVPTTTSAASDGTVTMKRHKRSRHDVSTSIPSPGPPPTKALPSRPPRSAAASPPTSPRRTGDIGVAIGVVRHNPSRSVTLDPHSRDLYDLTEAYGADDSGGRGQEDARNHGWNNSWGSQHGGVAPLSPRWKSSQKGDDDDDGMQGHVVLEDGELERLAGTYR